MQNLFLLYSWTPLHFAVDMRELAIIDFLVSNKCDMNLANKSHKTPLHIAVEKDYTDIFKMLMRGESDIQVNTIYHIFKRDIMVYCSLPHTIIIYILLRV